MINYIILIITSIISVAILAIILKIDIKKIKGLGMKEELNELANKYPSNIEICKKILKMLKNENVVVKEDLNAENCLYIVLTNKILIGDTKQSFSRIQTIAHECLHSVQDRRILIFNYIYSNIYLIYFMLSIILMIFKMYQNQLLHISIFLILSLIYYGIRSFLENDAMIKARFLAKEYMEKEKILSSEYNLKIVEGFDELNNLGIKCYNFTLIEGIFIKVIILSVVALIF